VSQKQKATQKQITIVKIDNRKQVRQRSNAVSVPPPPVLRGVSAIQPIIPLPPPPDLYESNVLRQRVERLERVREPVRQPIRTSTGTSTGIQTEAPIRASTGIQTEAPEQRLGGNRQTSRLLELPFSRQTQTEAPAPTQTAPAPVLRGVSAQTIDPPVMVRIPPAPPQLTSRQVFEKGIRFGETNVRQREQVAFTRGRRFEADVVRDRLKPVPDQPIRAEPAPEPAPPSPAPTEQLEPVAPVAPSAFGRTLDRKQLRSIGVTRPEVLRKMGVSLDEYKEKVFNKSFDMTNKGYNALVASEKKTVRDAVLSQDYGVI